MIVISLMILAVMFFRMVFAMGGPHADNYCFTFNLYDVYCFLIRYSCLLHHIVLNVIYLKKILNYTCCALSVWYTVHCHKMAPLFSFLDSLNCDTEIQN